LEECEIFLGKLLGQLEELLVYMRMRLFVNEIERAVAVGVGVFFGGRETMVFLGFGDSEKELVFPVAANTGCAKLSDKLYDARRVGA
jgi:hypothetical protein